MPTSPQLAARRAYAAQDRLARACNRIARGVSFVCEEVADGLWMFRVGIALWRDNRDGDNR